MESVVRKILSVSLTLASLQSFAQDIRPPSMENVAPWIISGVIANRVYNELYVNRRNYVYMDRPYVEHSGTHGQYLKGDSCVVDKRVYALTDRIIVQYVDQCDGLVIREVSQPR